MAAGGYQTRRQISMCCSPKQPSHVGRGCMEHGIPSPLCDTEYQEGLPCGSDSCVAGFRWPPDPRLQRCCPLQLSRSGWQRSHRWAAFYFCRFRLCVIIFCNIFKSLNTFCQGWPESYNFSGCSLGSRANTGPSRSAPCRWSAGVLALQGCQV